MDDEEKLKERIHAKKASTQDVENSNKELKRVKKQNEEFRDSIAKKYFGELDVGYCIEGRLDDEIERCRLELCELRGE